MLSVHAVAQKPQPRWVPSVFGGQRDVSPDGHPSRVGTATATGYSSPSSVASYQQFWIDLPFDRIEIKSVDRANVKLNRWAENLEVGVHFVTSLGIFVHGNGGGNSATWEAEKLVDV